jgi:hypothetical protein
MAANSSMHRHFKVFPSNVVQTGVEITLTASPGHDSLKPQCKAHVFFLSPWKNGTWEHVLLLDDGVGNHLPADMHSELISALWTSHASSD